MNEINCPHCGKAFKIDEAGYADILKQVRDTDFEKQLHGGLSWLSRTNRMLLNLLKPKPPMNHRKLPRQRKPKFRG
jgi:hypothetical protein